jgi:endoglucanase
MALDQEQALDILARLGAHPSVAFREDAVASQIRVVLEGLGLGCQVDRYGNLITVIRGENPSNDSMAIVAHMDHPGFEAVGLDRGHVVAKALGGVPASGFTEDVPVLMLTDDGRRVRGVTIGSIGDASSREVRIRPEESGPLRLPLTVVFDLPDFQLDGEFIRMRAVDDLAGCGALLSTLSALARRHPPGDVYGVFTRAEEVGLIGARLLAEAGGLPAECLIISAESSRALPGAEMGGGPVVRVGDAAFTFDDQAEAVLVRAREALQDRPDGFKAQRQLMSGGVCEASAFVFHGYRATGIAFPLGNYHNSGPEGEVAAEFIHRDDYLGGIELLVEAAYRVPERSQTAYRQRLSQVPEEERKRLESTRSSES